jgi:hypothetical protein
VTILFLLLSFIISACNAAADDVRHIVDDVTHGPYLNIGDLHASYGPPCVVEPQGNGTEVWSFCLVGCQAPNEDPHWCPAACDSACRAMQHFTVAGPYVIDWETPPYQRP